MGAVTTEFLNELQNLSKEEESVIRKFQADPTGASFVPVADLLRKRGYIEEAIVVLEDGVQNYPQYASARASLARDYYSQGMFDESLKASEAALAATPDNALAQRINLKILVLLDRREEALARLKNIARAVPDDGLTLAIRKAIAVNDWASAQRWVRSDLEKFGVYVDFESHQGHRPVKMSRPDLEISDPKDRSTSEVQSWVVPKEQILSERHQEGVGVSGHAQVGADRQGISGAVSGDVWEVRQRPERVQSPLSDLRSDSAERQSKIGTDLPEALRSGASLGHTEGDADRYLILRGFRRVGTRGYFVGRGQSSSSFSGLEKHTIAEIYRSQGSHMKALEIYEKLVREEPNSLHFRQNYEQLKRDLRRTLLRESLQDGKEAAAAQEEDEATQNAPPPGSTEDMHQDRRKATARAPLTLASLSLSDSQQAHRKALRIKYEPETCGSILNTQAGVNESPSSGVSCSPVDQPTDEMVTASQRKIQILTGILSKLDNTKDDLR